MASRPCFEAGLCTSRGALTTGIIVAIGLVRQRSCRSGVSLRDMHECAVEAHTQKGQSPFPKQVSIRLA